MEDLTELEHTVLAIVGLCAPCSGYRVRKCFLDSPSPHWSGSAGAIYPVLRRLDERALIETEEDTTSNRGGMLYSLTALGKHHVREWMAPPLDRTAMIDMDPLRTRVRMLGLLTPMQRRKFLAGALLALAEMEEIALDALEKSQRGPDPFHTLVCEGAVASVRARRAWLQGVVESVEQINKGEPDDALLSRIPPKRRAGRRGPSRPRSRRR